MPQPLTPFVATQSFLISTTDDTALQAYAQYVFPTLTTASVTGLNATGAAMFGTPTIYTVKYSVAAVASSTYNSPSVSTSNQITVTVIRSSAPVIFTNTTMYFQITPSNTTVFNAFNSPSSLALTPGSNDAVSFKNAVVAGTEQ